MPFGFHVLDLLLKITVFLISGCCFAKIFLGILAPLAKLAAMVIPDNDNVRLELPWWYG